METLKQPNNKLAPITTQVTITKKTFEEHLKAMESFPLSPSKIEILQINLGKLCNQVCEHCHVDAGPTRTEIMTKTVLKQCLEAAKLPQIHTIDLTGGAPEMNPNFRWFVAELFQLKKKIIVRSNLTILTYKKYLDLPQFFKDHNITVVSSLPCYTPENVDKQRGNGVFERSIKALKKLNELGYGKAGSGLELHLVYNPSGTALPPAQKALEGDYKKELKKVFDIEFNQLYTITNLPISRFLEDLLRTEQYEAYMNKLIDAFNPKTVPEVMCRNTISVGWDGQLFDCDFNQMLDLGIVSNSKHIADFDVAQLNNRSIVVGQHCFGCTAGAGSSCQGSIV